MRHHANIRHRGPWQICSHSYFFLIPRFLQKASRRLLNSGKWELGRLFWYRVQLIDGPDGEVFASEGVAVPLLCGLELELELELIRGSCLRYRCCWDGNSVSCIPGLAAAALLVCLGRARLSSVILSIFQVPSEMLHDEGTLLSYYLSILKKSAN